MSHVQQQQESLARFLAFMLGRRPDEFGLVPDAEGWLMVKDVLRVLAGEPGWAYVRERHLEELAHLVQPSRIELAAGRIRSLTRDQLPARETEARPPALLYHAITAKSHPVAVQHGLRPGAAGHLVLAANPALALKIGRRRDPQAVLATVRAQAAAQVGVTFSRYGDDLYLTTASLPPDFVQLPALPKERPERQPKKDKAPPATPPTPGSVLLDIQGQPLKPWKQKGKKKDPAWKEQTKRDRRRRS